ncbi:MAG: hypothetical protein AB7F64_08600 [Gammaproteobacteria bacterium]
MFKNILKKIDLILQLYFGLEDEESRPMNVEIANEKLMITTTNSFKRHKIKKSWEHFSSINAKRMNSEPQEKLGLAIGQAIAEELVIKFDDPKIKEE